MELPVSYGPGGLRDVTPITSATLRVIDLTAFIGRYVELKSDVAVYWSQVPQTAQGAGTFTFSTSRAAAVAASAEPSSGAVVPARLAADTAIQFFVTSLWTGVAIQAQSTSTSWVEVKTLSLKTTGA